MSRGLHRYMRHLRPLLLACTLPLTPPALAAPQLDLSIYQGEDGAIHLNREARWVDPYFATKALLAARSVGLHVERAAHAWIGWAMRHQLADGRFVRHCRTPPGPWLMCAVADADDAMLALWLHLLAELDAPPAWHDSMQRAQAQLRSLRDPQRGIYLISVAQPVGLFIDNVEVHAALLALARWRQRTGAPGEARRLVAEAGALRSAIERQFREPRGQRYRVSTQARDSQDFYPDEVAQLYPMIEGMDQDFAGWDEWMQRHGTTWLRMEADHYPWGLIALAGRRLGDARAACWVPRAAPLRHSARWNVLEEAIFQGLQRTNPDPALCGPGPG